MARRVLYETNYTFTPSTRTIVIQRYIPRERLILITNVTTGVPIFNFSDSRLTATSYSASASYTGAAGGQGTTTIVLAYNTTAMSGADRLQIMLDEPNELMAPSEALMDPVGKLRVSQPQSLIDTDFEYGLQPTKWENIQLVNNRASAFFLPNQPLGIQTGTTTVTAVNVTSGSRTVTVSTTAPPAVGTVVQITNTAYPPAEGFYVIDSVSAGTSFTYIMKNNAVSTANIFLTGQTLVFQSGMYTGAAIPLASITNNGTTVTVNTSYPHGLHIGNYVIARNYTASTFAPNGTWAITAVQSAYSFSFQVINAPTGTIAAGTIMARPEGVFYHRPFDGGVQYNCGSSFHGFQAFRQTRRYFRYQSGKGIQMSTNVIFKPGLNVDQMTNPAGNVAQVRTKIAHNLSPGVSITVAGTIPTTYNVTTTVTNVIDPYTFQYAISGSPGGLTGGVPYIVINNWFNAAMRIGMFDSQNGFFYEFDGQILYAVRRSTTQQISGNVSVTQNQSVVTGTNSYFARQLVPGDFISIRGMTYRVATIASDTSMTILPEYRGATIAGITVSRTVDTRVPQSSWNIDPMTGTGPSGYNLDLSRVQMLYMDYSWYGAGAVRFGFKDIKGEVQYIHRFTHNNVLTEAYMRSGNLPSRYETNTLGAYTNMTATLAVSGTTLSVTDTSLFPSSGSLMIQNPLTSTSLTSVTIADTAGGFTCASTTLAVGMNVTIVGTFGGTGSITGYATGNVYRISATNGSTTFTLQTLAGAAIVTTAGTPTGLTYIPSAYEYVNYTGKTATTFTGLTRGIGGSSPASVVTTSGSATITGGSLTTAAIQPGMFITGTGILDGTYVVSVVNGVSALLSQACVASGTITATVYAMGAVNAVHNFSATAPISVFGHTPQFSPFISHWGSSVIMDGRFDDDKSFVFTTGMTTATAVGTANTNALISLRIAPSVDNGITATFGLREIINRMQLTLRSVGVRADGNFLVQLYLNATLTGASNTFIQPLANPSSLAQIVIHPAGTTVSGGETVYAFYTEGSGAGSFATTGQDITFIRDLGNSVVGGGTNNAANSSGQVYPDGPDVLTVVVTNLEGASRNATARISWTEAQA